MIDRKAEADLIWYFAYGTRMSARSTLGGMLERAEVMSTDSTGKPHARPSPHDWNVVPVAHVHEEPSYTPDDGALVRCASVSRRLRRMPAEHAYVLELCYGDIGARWARTKAGRIFALYAITEAGRAYCEEAVKQSPESLRADERIARLADQQRSKPGGRGKQQLRAMHEQALTCLRGASKAWKEAAHGR